MEPRLRAVHGAEGRDADRLDLRRVGIKPDPYRMCTCFAREIAAVGTVEEFLALQILDRAFSSN